MWWINSYISKEFRSCTLDTSRSSSKHPEGEINGCVVSSAWWYTITMEVVWNNTLVMWYPSLYTQITVHWAITAAQMIGYREVEMSMCWVLDLVHRILCCIYLSICEREGKQLHKPLLSFVIILANMVRKLHIITDAFWTDASSRMSILTL